MSNGYTFAVIDHFKYQFSFKTHILIISFQNNSEIISVKTLLRIATALTFCAHTCRAHVLLGTAVKLQMPLTQTGIKSNYMLTSIKKPLT